jgi:uncharacterized protein YdbL (DUF1318 family)
MNMQTLTRRTMIGRVLAALLALLLVPAFARAAADDEATLQKRFKERYPQLRQLKSDGVIGETSEGYVDFVDKKDAKAADVVKEENDDRKALYKLLAEKEGTTAEKVAEIAGTRNLKKAKPGEYIKQGGKWTKKAAETPAK